MIKGEKNIYYWTSAFCINDDEIWFIYGKLCLLCKYTISTKVNKIIGVVPVDDPMKENLFQKVILAENKLFLIPCWANDIVVYDLKKNKFEIIKIKPQRGLKFSGAYVFKDKIVCLPASYEYVVGINIYDLTVNYEYSVKKIKQQDYIDYFNSTDKLEEQKIVLCSPQTDKIYCYDIERQILESKKIYKEKSGNKFEFILCIDNQIVLCDNKKHKILIYNYETKQLENIFWPVRKNLVAVFRLDDKIIIDDYETSWVGIYNKKFELLAEVKDSITQNRKYYYSYLVGSCESNCGENIYFNNCDMSFNWICNGLPEEKVRLLLSETDREYIKKNLFMCENIKKENYYYRLNDYLEGIL